MADTLTNLFNKRDKHKRSKMTSRLQEQQASFDTLTGETAGFIGTAETVQIKITETTNTTSDNVSVNLLDTPVDIGYADPVFQPWRTIVLSSDPPAPNLVPKYVTPGKRKNQPPGLQTMLPWPSPSEESPHHHHQDVGTCTTPFQQTTGASALLPIIPPVTDGPEYTFSCHVSPPPSPEQEEVDEGMYGYYNYDNGVCKVEYRDLPHDSMYTHMTEYHTKIFLGQIPYTLKKEQLASVLSYLVGAFIPEQYIILMKNTATNTSYGAGFVFVSPDHAQTLLGNSFRVLLRDDHMYVEVDPGALLRLRTYEITDQKGPQPMRIERAKETADQRMTRASLPPRPPSVSLSMQFSALSAPPFEQPPPSSNHYAYGAMYYAASSFP